VFNEKKISHFVDEFLSNCNFVEKRNLGNFNQDLPKQGEVKKNVQTIV